MVARAAAVVLAAGSGTRTGLAVNKVLVPIAGRSALERSLATLETVSAIGTVVVVVREVDRGVADALVRPFAKVSDVVAGGSTRLASERAGLAVLGPAVAEGAVDVICVHDAARPFASPALVDRLVSAARVHGGAVPGQPLAPGVFRREGRRVVPVDVGALWRVQTPQAFRAAPLLAAYAAAADSLEAVDTAECVARFVPGLGVVVVPGEDENLKITTAADLDVATRIATRDRNAR